MALRVGRSLARRLSLTPSAFVSDTSAFGRSISTYTLPDLPYDYNAIEPVVSTEIMKLHHSKHHQAYVNGLNASLEKYSKAKSGSDIGNMIALQAAIKFNGGGHLNHSLFWTNLCPPKEYKEPGGKLLQAMQEEFGSLDTFIAKFNAQATAVQGSGWGWLGYEAGAKRLVIETTANQDPLSTKGLIPLLGIDVWEHAYYLQYKNVRPDYLKEIWKVVNWETVESRLAGAAK